MPEPEPTEKSGQTEINEPKRFKRRTILRAGVSAVAATAILGITGVTGIVNSESAPKPVKFDAEPLHPDPNDVIISYGSDGLPESVLLPDGTNIIYQKDDVIKKRDEAKTTGEPTILALYKLPPHRIPDNGPPTVIKQANMSEHPPIPSLPTDALSDHELSKRGVEIIQPDNTKLYIGQNAFENGGLLDGLDFPGGLKIVLVDQPALAKGLLTDPKYDSVRDFLLDDNVAKLRQQQLAGFETLLTQNKKNLPRNDHDHIDATTGLWGAEAGFLNTKQNILAMNTGIFTDKLLLRKKNARLNPLTILPQKASDPAIIFQAMGDFAHVYAKSLYFTPRGEFKTMELTDNSMLYLYPRWPMLDASQTFPDLADFHLNSTTANDAEVYTNKTPGFRLRWAIEKLRQFKKFGQIDEREAEKNAAEGIYRAHGNDKAFSLIYQDPNPINRSGNYIRT